MARNGAVRTKRGPAPLSPSAMELWPASKIETRPLASLVPYARNARQHSDAQIAQIAASIQEWGWTIPILVDETDRIIAGHGRLMAGLKLGLTDGPVMVARGWSQSKIRAYVIADNKLAENASWDEELLRLELSDLKVDGFDLGLMGFDVAYLYDLFSSDAPLPEKYTRKLQTPVYEPTSEQPPLQDLTDSRKTEELVEAINGSSVSEDEKAFLRSAAQRHVVFDYHNIAEYYCHASADMQALMEQSALVIIDFRKAIRGGFVEMAERIAGLCPEAGDDEEAFDGQ